VATQHSLHLFGRGVGPLLIHHHHHHPSPSISVCSFPALFMVLVLQSAHREIHFVVPWHIFHFCVCAMLAVSGRYLEFHLAYGTGDIALPQCNLALDLLLDTCLVHWYIYNPGSWDVYRIRCPSAAQSPLSLAQLLDPPCSSIAVPREAAISSPRSDPTN
jgi:hypothetical protein